MAVMNLSDPPILQRLAPQPGAPLFGAPRPERPRAPANPPTLFAWTWPTDWQGSSGLRLGRPSAIARCQRAKTQKIERAPTQSRAGQMP